MNAYVVTHWYASNIPDKEGNYIHIAGRKAGLMDYLLTLLKLNSRVLLKISDVGLVFAESSVFAERNVNTPLAKVTSTLYGWKRPFWEALVISMGVLWLVSGVAGAMVMTMAGEGSSSLLLLGCLGGGALLAAIAGGLYYRLNRVLTLGIVTECGETYWLRLKRSLIENVKLDQPLAEAASKIVDSLVLARCAGTQSANFGSVAPVAQTRPASPVSVPASAPTPPAPAPPSAASKGTRRVGPLSNAASPPAPTPTPTASSGPRATCIYCATRVAFPPEGVGMEVPCPTCGKPLLLVAS